jgi:hypothetical protein
MKVISLGSQVVEVMINGNKLTFEPHASHNPIIEQWRKLVLVWL